MLVYKFIGVFIKVSFLNNGREKNLLLFHVEGLLFHVEGGACISDLNQVENLFSSFYFKTKKR